MTVRKFIDEVNAVLRGRKIGVGIQHLIAGPKMLSIF